MFTAARIVRVHLVDEIEIVLAKFHEGNRRAKMLAQFRITVRRGDGLHPILRERFLGLAGDGAQREPMSVTEGPKDSAMERAGPSPQRRRLIVVDRDS